MPVDEITLQQQAAEPYQEEVFRELIDAGVFYGRMRTKTNPRMKPFIFGNRAGVEVIDLAKTLEGVEAATAALKEKVRAGAQILFVATQPAAGSVAVLTEHFGYPLIVKRWIGGALTNFPTISKRIEHFKKLKADRVAGALQKYTKKERLNIARDIARYEELFGGLEKLARIPELLVVIDPVVHHTAVREAKRLGIPVIAYGNTDCDPDAIRYLVVGNTAARKSIDWFVGKLRQALEEVKTEVPAEQTAPTDTNVSSQ